MSEADGDLKKNVVGGIGAVVVILLLLALVLGGITCGIRVIGGEEAYELWLYRNGVKSGDHITRHDNGEVSSIQPYSRGKINGVVRDFDAKGRPTRRVAYKNGIQNGPYTLFHANGEVKERGEHFSGKTFGEVERFDEEGEPLDP